ncbi:MAG: 6-carboxyhexanoate--CoA ligase, partial [Kiritimatiellae bacterium]|nr:6-carboxyhexanoate--CoA ligase [Kiritimatiellia bacterium]
MSDGRLYCVKMRASLDGRHVSGAERIAGARDIPAAVSALAERAIGHPRGEPDFVGVKIERIGEPVRLKALPVTTYATSSAEEGRAKAAQLLREAGITRIDEIMEMFGETSSMRGAMLLDADTLERLEYDRERGIRATYMDDSAQTGRCPRKNHFAEALVLSTKVLSAPGIVGEICVSDDPDYTTGYVSAKSIGYSRITTIKNAGSPDGGRIFLYRGERNKVGETIRYLERQPVIVDLPGEFFRTGNRWDAIDAELDGIRAKRLERFCRTVERKEGMHATVDGRDLAVFSSNDYLGLSEDARVKSAAAEAALRWGAGTGGSRLATGTNPPHVELERHLARFKKAEGAISFATGYMANVGTIQSMVGKGDVVFSDELNHASIIDGCRLSGAEVVVYRHLDMADLERRLKSAWRCRRRLAVSDAVFSMDGDLLDLPAFGAICRRYDAFSMIDEAHAFGVLGKCGRGLAEHFGCEDADITLGTLSKAAGAEGAFVCASARLIDCLRNRARSFIFSTAPAPACAAAADCAVSIIESEPDRVGRLRANAVFF